MFLNLPTNNPALAFELMLYYTSSFWDAKQYRLLSGSFETSGTTHPTTEHHVPEDLNPHRYEDLKIRSTITNFHASHLLTIKVGTSGCQSSKPSDISSLTSVCQQEVTTQL
jgi:hypothetical protein